MLVRQIRFAFSIAILLSCSTLAGLLADWIRAYTFDIDFKQQSFILLCAGLAFLFWDHFFLLRTTAHTHYEYRLFSYLISGFVGFACLAVARLVPIFFSENLWDALSNSLTVVGIFLLLITVLLRFTNSRQQSRVWSIIWLTGLGTLVFLLSRGLFTYLLLCLISIYAGRGVLGLLGITELNKKSLAPFATLVFWSILLGFFVGIGIPIKYLSLIIWPLTIWLIWWGTKNKDLDLSLNMGDLLLFVIPLLLVFKYTLYGFFDYPGSSNMDHWNYVAVGQYLWEFSRCAQGILPPIYKFSNEFACTFRYISPGLLSLFSGLLNRVGDAQPSAGVFLPWGMFVYCSSLCFMIENITTSRVIRTAYLLFGALAGWLMMLVIASNFDNLLIIPYLPVIFAISLLIDFSWRWNIALGLVLASVGYTYPEMVPFIYTAAGIFILKQIISVRLSLLRISIAFITIIVSGLTVLLPYFSTAVLFLQRQVNAVSASGEALPGQGFWPELISPTYQWIALWGMGGGIYDGGFYAFRTAVAVLLYALLSYGCFLLIKAKEWALLVVLIIFACAMLYFDFYRSYAYGTYKLLVLFWWLIAYVVVLAFKKIIDVNPESRKTIYVAGASGYFAYLISVTVLAAHVTVLPYNSIETFKQLEDLPIPPGKSVAAIIADNYNNIWAAYYLRNDDIFLYPMGGYMVGYVDPFGSDVKQAKLEDVQYLLTDSNSLTLPGKMVWHNSRYSLLELPDTWAYGFDIKNPNGLETVNGKLFFWLGNDPVEVRIISDFGGCGQITFDADLGPSLPDISKRYLSYSNNGEKNSTIVTPGFVNLFINLNEGVDNIITLQVLDKPDLFLQSNGDGRTMLLGVFDFSVKKCNSPQTIGN